MKILPFFLSACALFLSSCSRYYVNTLSSSSAQIDQNTGGFKYENDSLLITYSFYGQNAPIHIEVQNKLNEPLYIDWSRSAVIINNRAVAYSGNKVSIRGSISGDSYSWSNSYRSLDGNLSATATLPEGVTFIPPKSSIDRVPLMLTNKGFDHLSDSVYREKETLYPERGPVKVRVASFSEENSPLRFQSYLTFYRGTNGGVRPSTYQHDFFVSKSIKTTASPENVAEYQNRSQNLFYTSKRTGYGKVMSGVAVATALIAVNALERSETASSYR